MSVVAGTPSMEVPKAWEIRTRSPWVTLTMTARRWSVSIALRTTSALADADASGEVAGAADATPATPATSPDAWVAGAADATADEPSETAARIDPSMSPR